MGNLNIFKKNKRPLGLLSRDPVDIRDYQLAEIQDKRVELPDEFDLRDKMTPVGDQNYGTCTSWAGCAVKEYWDKKEYGRDINLSEKFNYYNIKKISGLWTIEGDYLRNSFKALCEYGAPLLEDYPDTRDGSWENYLNEPPQELYEKAKKYKAKTYWSVDRTLESFRQAIFQNNCPIGTGMKWFRAYYDEGSDGYLPRPAGDKVGGHAIACAGWTKDGKLWFKNSWGADYGKDGYFYIPFEEFTKHDFWNAWISLDEEAPEPQIKGWVAGSYLELIRNYKKEEIVTPTYNLNFRTGPWERVIKVVKPGEELRITGNVKHGNYLWYEVELIKNEEK